MQKKSGNGQGGSGNSHNYFLPDRTEYPIPTELKISFRISVVVPNNSGSLLVGLSRSVRREERRVDNS